MAVEAGNGDEVVVFRHFGSGRALVGAAATSLAVVGMVAMSATAFADDTASSDKPLPGTAVYRTTDRGIVNAGPSGSLSAPRGTAWGSRNVTPVGTPILIHDGNPTTLCYANSAFDAATCGLAK